MRSSDRESNSEETTQTDPDLWQDGGETPPHSREQQGGPSQEANSVDRSGELKEEYVPPSERYGAGEEEDESALGWGDIKGPIHVKVLLLLMVLGSKVWHMKVVGLHWLLPRITGNTDPKEGISGYFYPEDMIGDDEYIVHEGNPSRWVMIGPYIAAFFMLFTSVVVTIGVPLGYGEAMLNLVTPDVINLSVPNRWWYFPIVLVTIATLLLTRQAIQRGSTWHIVTNRQILHRSHIINTTKQRFDLHEIQNVEDHYPPPERFYGVGHIDFFTAGTGGSEVRFYGVDNPSDLIKDIKHHMREAKERRVRGDVSTDGAGERASENPPPEQEHQNQPEQQQSAQRADGAAGRQEEPRPEQRASQEPDGVREDDQNESGDESDSKDYPWRQPPNEEGDSIEEQVTKQSLRDDMRDINDR